MFVPVNVHFSSVFLELKSSYWTPRQISEHFHHTGDAVGQLWLCLPLVSRSWSLFQMDDVLGQACWEGEKLKTSKHQSIRLHLMLGAGPSAFQGWKVLSF